MQIFFCEVFIYKYVPRSDTLPRMETPKSSCPKKHEDGIVNRRHTQQALGKLRMNAPFDELQVSAQGCLASIIGLSMYHTVGCMHTPEAVSRSSK